MKNNLKTHQVWKYASIFIFALLLLSVASPTTNNSNVEGDTPERRTAASEPFIGEIAMFAGNFAPRGWALCNGQLLPIAQNQALFSILGTTYGGDGRSTFALPDMRGRVAVHAGNGPGLSPYNLGKKGGAESVQLNPVNIAPNRNGKTQVGRTEPNASNVQPYVTINYIIALQGVFPSRS